MAQKTKSIKRTRKPKKTKKVKRVKRGKKKRSSRVQSVLLDRDYFTLKSAINWIKSHGFVHKKVDKTKRYYRFRQFNPRSDRSYRTISPKYKKGIKFIIEF
jgi:hypothetical protein